MIEKKQLNKNGMKILAHLNKNELVKQGIVEELGPQILEKLQHTLEFEEEFLFNKPISRKLSILKIKEEDKIETQLLVNGNNKDVLMEKNLNTVSHQANGDVQ